MAVTPPPPPPPYTLCKYRYEGVSYHLGEEVRSHSLALELVAEKKREHHSICFGLVSGYPHEMRISLIEGLPLGFFLWREICGLISFEYRFYFQSPAQTQ